MNYDPAKDEPTSCTIHFKEANDMDAAEAAVYGPLEKELEEQTATSPSKFKVLRNALALEVSFHGTHKGTSVIEMAKTRPDAHIVACGDGGSDEEMFKAGQEHKIKHGDAMGATLGIRINVGGEEGSKKATHGDICIMDPGTIMGTEMDIRDRNVERQAAGKKGTIPVPGILNALSYLAHGAAA